MTGYITFAAHTSVDVRKNQNLFHVHFFQSKLQFFVKGFSKFEVLVRVATNSAKTAIHIIIEQFHPLRRLCVC